jgi:hypothetical protein
MVDLRDVVGGDIEFAKRALKPAAEMSVEFRIPVDKKSAVPSHRAPGPLRRDTAMIVLPEEA